MSKVSYARANFSLEANTLIVQEVGQLNGETTEEIISAVIEILRPRTEEASVEKLVFELGKTTIADAERELIVRTLEHASNNKAEAARQLGIDVKTIYNKLKSYDIDA